MIYLAGEITPQMYLDVAGSLDDQPLSINMCLNSEGGDILSAFAIYDRIVTIPESTITATGECSSAAIVVLQAAKIRRATPHTQFCIHLCVAEVKTPPTLEEALEHQRMKVRIDQTIFKIYGYRIKPENVQRALSLRVFDVKTALALGFIDEVWDGR